LDLTILKKYKTKNSSLGFFEPRKINEGVRPDNNKGKVDSKNRQGSARERILRPSEKTLGHVSTIGQPETKDALRIALRGFV